jgi:hypothetical protein
MHPLDTASAIGNKAVQFGQDLGNQIVDDPLTAAKGAAIGIGNSLTFGVLKKGTAYLNSLDGTGKSYEDSLKDQDEFYKSLGPAETAGELGAAFVPGVGELALLNRGVGAVKTASRLAKVATGAGIGGAEGLASYAGHNEGAFSPVDAATSTVLGAAGGAIPGALDAHTLEQKAGSFLKDAGGDASKAARDAEITGDLKALQSREAQSGTALGPKQANQVAAGYTQDAMKAVREMPAGAEKDALVEALDKGAGWSDARVNALRTSDAGNAVADAIQKRVRTDALTAAVPASTNPLTKVGRALVDNFVPIAPLRHAINGALGSRTYRPQTIANLLKNSDNAAAFLQVNGGSAASKSAQSLAGMAAQAQNFQGPLQQAARAAGSGGRAAPTAEELAAKAQAARALDIAKRTAGYRKDNQTQWAQNRAASTAEQVAQEQQANAQAADEAARQASIAKRTEFARQQNLAGFQGNTQAERAAQAAAEQQAQAADLARKAQSRTAVGNLVNQNADNAAQAGAARAAQATATQTKTAEAVQRAQAATADRAARSEAARQARVSGEADEAKATAASVKAEARAKVKADKEAAAKAQAEQYQVAGQRVANGDFTGLDIEHPRMQHMLKFVNSDDPAVIKQAVSQVAQADPEHAAVAAQTMTHGAPQANYYQLQKALQDKLGKRTPVAPTDAPSAQPAALTLEEQMRLAKYNGGIKNNQSLVETVKAQAEDGDVKTMLAKMGTKSTPEDRKAILDKFLSQHSDATKVISAKRLGEQLIEGVTK